ncbi:MAG: tetrahydromethanopterin S-methyltransferase subunit F [Methanomicrobiales archaeon]|nr:tetrahydromethanopterin S-methyltransferase subunit F [Methanomicrobiales archaeon]MDI6875918.1 tetrahydromethanopterin S-methyltransferase subunit F [Methanomicrobiales archaeon]
MAEETKAPSAIRMAAIDAMVENMRYKAQILARTNKLESGVISSGVMGFAIGLAFALILVVVPVLVL